MPSIWSGSTGSFATVTEQTRHTSCYPGAVIVLMSLAALSRTDWRDGRDDATSMTTTQGPGCRLPVTSKARRALLSGTGEAQKQERVAGDQDESVSVLHTPLTSPGGDLQKSVALR